MSSTTGENRILIIRPSALGDVCRTVPVLVSLRRAQPKARIEWVVRDSFVEAVEAHPDLDEVIAFPRRRFGKWWRRPDLTLQAARWFADLRGRAYDLVVDCQGLGRSGLMSAATGASRRVGYRGARELAWLGYNVRYAGPRREHTVDQMLNLLRAEGIEPVCDLRLHVPAPAREWWAAQLSSAQLEGARYAVLAPTVRWRSKRWPAERWACLIRELLHREYNAIVLIGAPGEEPQVDAVASAHERGSNVLNLAGRTSVGQTMAIIASSSLVIAHDSAPLHMAEGLSAPSVGLFGPTDPALVGPYFSPESALRVWKPDNGGEVNYRDRRLGDSLMRQIEVRDVLERIERVVAMSVPEGRGACRSDRRGAPA
jgi:lipopolysaccharide heptosyltransferase I